MPGQTPEVRHEGPGRLHIVVFLAGLALLLVSLGLDWVHFLRMVGFPAEKLYHPRVQADLATLRRLSVVAASLLMICPILLWRYPRVVARLSQSIEGVRAVAARLPMFVPLAVATLVLMKTVLQLTLYLLGYSAYAADDFARTLKADDWARHPRFDLGWEWGNLVLGGGGQLPFADYLFGLGLALRRDLFLTPKVVNLAVSCVAVVAVYLLGRELFGRTAGLVTASLFALQPWNVWLGISGMTSDLPSVVLITLFALFLFRWFEDGQPRTLLAAASLSAIANGFRYENWFFALTVSLLIVYDLLSRWRQRCLTSQSITAALCALALVNAFPVIWMATSYYVLGDWLPALHVTNAELVTSQGRWPKISIPVLALSSFPFEIALALAGISLYLTKGRRASHRRYLLTLLVTFLLFNVVFKGQLAQHGGGVSRLLLAFVVFSLPYAGFVLSRLLVAPEPRRTGSVVAGCLLLLVVWAFEIVRAFNYPTTSFPMEAIHAGRTLRALQETGTIPENAKILIERDEEWGYIGIVALANRPERFVLLNELAYRQRIALPGDPANRPEPDSVRGRACEGGFQADACRRSFEAERFDLVILSSPEQVRSFLDMFHGRSWRMGRYHIFDASSFAPSRDSFRKRPDDGPA
jgi:hypothetical protein